MFKKKLTKLLCIVLCLSICCPVVSLAVDEERIEKEPPCVDYVNITSNQCSLSISGINSTSSASLHANASMSLKIKMELQKIKSGTYTTIETWTASKTGTSLSMEEDRLINILATYRLKVTFTAGSETVVSYAYP